MRSNRLLLLFLGLAGLVLASCGDEQGATGLDPGEGDQTDEQAIRALMTQEDDYFSSGESMGDEQVEVGSSAKPSPSGAPIESFFFIRRITHREIVRDIHIEYPPDRPAVATVETREELEGIFRLFFDDPDRIYLPGVIDKPLAAAARHRAVFVQRPRASRDPFRGWRLVEVSGVEIPSKPTTKNIVSVEISSESVDVTITDPLELVRVTELPAFRPGEEVTLRVTTSDETDFVFLHTGHGKDEFRPVGGGVFEGSWTVGERRGPRRVGIDVIDRETLFDDEAPYDSLIWVLRFRVSGESMEPFAGME